MCVYEMLPQLCHQKHGHWSVIVRHSYHSANSPWLVLRTEIHPGIYLSGVPPFSDLRDAAILCCLGIDGQWNFVLHSELCLKEILITIIIPAVCGFGLWSWTAILPFCLHLYFWYLTSLSWCGCHSCCPCSCGCCSCSCSYCCCCCRRHRRRRRPRRRRRCCCCCCCCCCCRCHCPCPCRCHCRCHCRCRCHCCCCSHYDGFICCLLLLFLLLSVLVSRTALCCWCHGCFCCCNSCSSCIGLVYCWHPCCCQSWFPGQLWLLLLMS